MSLEFRGIKKLLPLLILTLVCFFAGSAVLAQTANQITSRVDSRHMGVLANHPPLWASSSNSVGAIPADQMLDQMTMVLARPPQQEKAFVQLLEDQQNPSSGEYHHWLTPQEIGDRFGPSESDLATVTAWLQSQGLQIKWTSASRTMIGFGGSAQNIGHAFATELHYYNVNGEKRMSANSDAKIPAALATIIKGVRGLSTPDERPLLRRMAKPMMSLSGSHYLSPTDFNTIYNVPSAMTGAGQTVGIVGISRTNFADFDHFRKLTGAAFSNPTEVIPTAFAGVDPGTAATSKGYYPQGQDEATLDVVRAGSVAPGANLLLVTSGTSCLGTGLVADALYLLETTPLPAQIMSISFGGCESENTVFDASFWDGIFKQAAAEGISVFVSSGDSGASTCDSSFATPPASPSANSINRICSSSYATCVGGTEFADGVNGASYWSSTNGTGLASALGYIPEGAWNEPLDSSSKPVAAASGGGVSQVIATPSWQVGTGVPAARSGRYVPDVSFSSALHDGYLLCFAPDGAACSSTSDIAVFGGTSAAAPSMAGIAALINQKMGGAQGNLNPSLYQLAANSPGVFHDVTVSSSGISNCDVNTPSMCNNSIPGTSGLSGGQAGYLVTSGFDEATGLGSMDVTELLNTMGNGVAAQAPVLSPAAGTYANAQAVTITDASIGTSIYYTTDGSTPTTSSTVYSGAITVGSTQTVHAIAAGNGYSASPVATAAYIINANAAQVAAPVFSSPSGIYTTSLSVTISSSTAGAQIYYTTDGSTPTASSNLYSGAIEVSRPTTIRAIAMVSGHFNSAISSASYSVLTGEWTWVSGPNLGNQAAVYGTFGVEAATNQPGSRDGASTWADSQGNLWLFGGSGSQTNTTSTSQTLLMDKNDLWRFNPSTKQWAWVGGSSNAGQDGVYGTQGVAAATNQPGARLDALSWTDSSGNFWLFGGEHIIATNTGQGYYSDQTVYFNDLWMYSPSTGYWTWVSGSNAVNQAGVYGTQGVAAAANTPGARALASFTTDHNGNFWLFGGMGNAAGNSTLWMFNPTTKMWTWMSGPSTSEAGDVYGTLGTPSALTHPGYRIGSSAWADSGGNIWLFGGSTGSRYDNSNSLWMFNPTTSQWTWEGGYSYGDSGHDVSGVYGPVGVSSTSNIPAGRSYASSWTDSSGSVWLFGGYTGESKGGQLNDLWQFSLSSKQWTLMRGDSSLNQNGNYGVLGVSAPDNIPGARQNASTWVDKNGTLWLWGGSRIIADWSVSDFSTDFSDLWSFSPGLTTLAPAATPTFSIAAGSYTTAQTVTISDATAGAAIYYTTDGTTPTISSTVYSGPIMVSATETLEAIATASGYSTSAVASAAYTINLPAADTPTFSPAAGTYTTPQTVTISDSTAGATIYYTTNGTTPTASSTPYSGPISVSASETLEAIAMAGGYSTSAVATAAYTINLPAATPTFSVAAGTYTTAQTVTISDATAGATIYYTTNGTTPTTGSTVYSGPITVSSSETLEAIATASGYSTSAVATAAYTINIPTNPVPVLGSMSPAYTDAGGAAFTLTVSGSAFTAASKVYWGSSALTTQYVSATQLTAQVPAASIASSGSTAITVQTPTPGGGSSNSLQFEVDSATTGTTPPAFTSLTATVPAGSTATYPVTLPSTATSITATCLNLPAGASCSYSSTTNAVTITTSSTTPKGTYQVTVVFTQTMPGAASAVILLPILLLPLVFVRWRLAARGVWFAACLGVILMTGAAFATGCGGGGGSSSTPVTPTNPTHQVTSSGAVSLTIQ